VETVPFAAPTRPHALGDLLLARAAQKALATDDADVTFSDQRCWGADVVRPGGGVQRAYAKHRQRSYRGALWRAMNKAFHALSPRERARLYVDDRLYAPPGPRCVIANSEMVRRELHKHFPHLEGRVKVVRNGVDTERFRPELRGLHAAAVRKALGIPEEALVGVFVGHDWRRKGLHTFIEALGVLERKRTAMGPARRAYGIVVGKGARGRAEGFARKVGAGQVLRFVGPARPDAYYGAGDLLVLPTYYDTFGMVVLEGMACGLPAITSVCSGAHEVITPGGDGFYLSDPSDSAQLAGFIEHYFDESALRAGSEAARATACRHTFGAMCEEIVSLLAAVAAQKRETPTP